MVTTGRVLAGRYRLLEHRGRGGMGEVLAAEDERLGRRVAVKVLSPELAADPAAVARFRREARAAAALSHPNVVRVLDAASDGDLHFIVMELVEGPTLAERLRDEGPLDPDDALTVATAVARGLEAAHRSGLVHRDVKPSNVLLTAAGQPKVADFGIAAAVDASTTVTAVHGSVPYVAPEQARGGRSDARTDVYGLGCVIFEMLTGRPPFTGDTSAAVLSQHLHEPPPAPSTLREGLPADLDTVVLAALAKDPGRRYPDVAALRADLERLAAGRAPGGVPPSPTTPLPVGDPTVRVDGASGDGHAVAAAGSRTGEDTAEVSPRNRGRSRRWWGRVAGVAAAAALVAAAAVAGGPGRVGGSSGGERPDTAAPSSPEPTPTPSGERTEPERTPSPTDDDPEGTLRRLLEDGGVREALEEGDLEEISEGDLKEIEAALEDLLGSPGEDPGPDRGKGRARGHDGDEEDRERLEELRERIEESRGGD